MSLINANEERAAAELDRNRVIALLACYFLLHIVIRLLVSDSAELDESEQLILGQELRWGYGPQPPMYTWLQVSLFAFFGTNVFALALLKNLLLFSVYFCTYLSTKEITGQRSVALAAMLSLLFMPQIAWECQRDLTHSVLVCASIALTLYIFIRLLKTRRTSYYVLLGVCAGMGVLSKHSFWIFFVGVLLAALSIRDFREIVAERRMLLCLPGFLAIASGHFLWTWLNMGPTLSATSKFNMARAGGILTSYLMGLTDLGKGVAAILLPSLILYGLVLRGAPPAVPPTVAPTDEEGDYRKLIGRAIVACLIISAAMLLIFRVTNVKERWVQPLLIPAPVYIVLAVRRRLSPGRARKIIALAGVVMVAVLVAVPSRTLLASYFGRQTRLNAPYSVLVKQLEGLGFRGGLIVAQDRLVGGNMKLFFKESVVVVPELPTFASHENVPGLIVWNAKGKESIPRDLVDFVNSRYALDLSTLVPRFMEAPYHYSVTERMRLGFILPESRRPGD